MPTTLADAPAVTAGIPYTVDTGEKLVNETFGPNNIRRRRTGTHELHTMSVRNGRRAARELSLDGSGFVLVEHQTRVQDFFDAEELKAVYYPEVERLIGELSGASRVVLFDHTLRSGDEGEREARLVREPVLSAHNDYTEWSGPQRVRDILPDEAEKLLSRRFAIIQVWRAINRPIEANPLAVADARSVAPEDLLVAERRYPNRVGQTYRLKYSPSHRWYYFPGCGGTRRWCSRCSTRRRTAGRASRPTPRSTIRRRPRTRRRARASRRARSPSSIREAPRSPACQVYPDRNCQGIPDRKPARIGL